MRWVLKGSPHRHDQVALEVLRQMRTADGAGWSDETHELARVICAVHGNRVGTVRIGPGLPTLVVDEPELRHPMLVMWDEGRTSEAHELWLERTLEPGASFCRRCGHVEMPSRKEALRRISERESKLFAYPVGADEGIRRGRPTNRAGD